MAEAPRVEIIARDSNDNSLGVFVDTTIDESFPYEYDPVALTSVIAAYLEGLGEGVVVTASSVAAPVSTQIYPAN